MTADRSQDDPTRSFMALTGGTMVAHYRIVEKLGAGGMGEVYLADDTRLDRRVALKFLPAAVAGNPDLRARFTREAKAVAKINHPNVVTIHEVGEFNGRPFFAMEHIEGKSLRERLKEKACDADDVIDLALQICDGLNKAHEAGITHRDIKPSNIVIDADGRPKLVDFGLAAIEGMDQVTRTGSTLGTVGYMSPEQIRAKKIDQRSDLFSFGVVLYEMITGRRPFAGDTEAAVMNAVLNDAVEPLSRYKSGVSGELQNIVAKLLEKDRDLRYQNVPGVISDLKRLRRDSDKSLASHIPQPGGTKNIRNYVPVAAVIVVVIIIAVVAIVLKPWKSGQVAEPEIQAGGNRLAIMYFDNLADPADSLKLGEIAANLLITDLSESQYVQVVSNQRLYDVLKLLGREGVKKIDPGTALQVAQKANARWMLQGSILQMDPEIELTAQLVDVSSGNTVAGQRVKGTPGESIFSLVDKLTVAVKGDLALPEAAMSEKDQPVANVTTHSPEAYRYYLEGVENGFRFYFPEAERDFKKAIELDSTFAMAYYRLSTLSAGIEQMQYADKALKYSKNVNSRERLTIEAYYALVNGDTNKAIATCMEIIRRYPEDKETHFNIGYMYRSSGKNLDSAIYYMSGAIALDSLYAPAYNMLAYIYNDLGNFDKSLWAINKYIELEPNQANPYDSRAELYAAAGKIDEAMSSYRKALEIKPDFFMSWEGLGYMHIYRQEYDKARQCIEKFMETPDKSDRSKARRDMALILMYQGRLQEALEIVEQCIAADRLEKGEIWTDQFMAAGIYLEQGEIDKSLDAMQQVMDEYFSDRGHISPINNFYIKILAENDRLPEAEKRLAKWKESIAPGDSSALAFWWFGAAYVEWAKGNYQPAIHYFQATFGRLKNKQAPYGFHCLYALARAYLENGQLGEAVQAFEQMSSNYSKGRLQWAIDAAKLHYYLGMAYEQSGWTDKAIAQYKTFLDIWKNADSGLAAVTDANQRLALLQSNP